MNMTITEALAELKTVQARVGKKREFVTGILARQEKFKDPHAKEEGGSAGVIARERQAINDLEERVILIRSAVQLANRSNAITVSGETRTIHDWLVWRRDVAPTQKQFLDNMRRAVSTIRQQAQQKGFNVIAGAEAAKPDDVIVNVDEFALAEEIEKMEEVLGALDGQLSLKNATIVIEL